MLSSIFLWCLIGAFVIALLYLLVGDALEIIDVLDGVLHPFTIIAFSAFFGGSGLILEKTTNLSDNILLVSSILIALILSILIYFYIVIPSKKSESSIGYAQKETEGLTGILYVGCPENGFGEVVFSYGGRTINEIAASYDGTSIPTDTKVLIIEVKDSVYYVSPLGEL